MFDVLKQKENKNQNKQELDFVSNDSLTAFNTFKAKVEKKFSNLENPLKVSKLDSTINVLIPIKVYEYFLILKEQGKSSFEFGLNTMSEKLKGSYGREVPSYYININSENPETLTALENEIYNAYYGPFCVKDKKVHPALPNLAEAHKNHKVLHSDHAPELLIIPFPEAHDSKMPTIKVGTYNVLQNDSGHGYSVPGTGAIQGKYAETDVEADARFKRIAKSIKAFAGQQNLHFITLQEIGGSEDNNVLLKYILQELGEYWDTSYFKKEIVTGKGSCITLHNTKFFESTLTDDTPVGELTNDALHGIVTSYKLTGTEHNVKILNVHAPFSQKPTLHEKEIKKFLTDAGNKKVKGIVAGDLNGTFASQIATTDPKRLIDSFEEVAENNITSHAPAYLSEKTKKPNLYSIDGGFHNLILSNGNVKVKQSQRKHLDQETGKTLDKIGPLDLEALLPEQQEFAKEWRPAISVDDDFNEIKHISDTQTISDYESSLRTAFNTDEILVRYATNLNSQSGLSIDLPVNIFSSLHSLANDSVPIQLYEFFQKNEDFDDVPFYRVGAAKPDVGKLVSALDFLVANQTFAALGKNIYLIERKEKERLITAFKDEIFKAFKQAWPTANLQNFKDNYFASDEFNSKLQEEMKTIQQTIDMGHVGKLKEFYQKTYSEMSQQNDQSNQPYPIMIDHFIGLTTDLYDDKNLTQKEIEKSFDNLKVKLYGKEPMSITLKTILCVVFGALIGFVVGAVVGAAIGAAVTAPAAGVGAIPGAIVGAVKGFTVGTAAGISVAGASSVGAGLYGLFSAQKNNETYSKRKEELGLFEEGFVGSELKDALIGHAVKPK